MNFTENLVAQLSSKHLLKHPFYQDWQNGSVAPETLKLYAQQYYHHVKAFPRYLSAIHSNCEDIETRQVLLENLIDEERGEENHPELWMRFAETWETDRQKIRQEAPMPETRQLIDTFMGHARSSMAAGLGVLFAYEHQIPEIARFKTDCLVEHYGVTDSRKLEFFRVHEKADIYHSQALASIMNQLSTTEQETVRTAALDGADKLWGFLDGVQATRS